MTRQKSNPPSIRIITTLPHPPPDSFRLLEMKYPITTEQQRQQQQQQQPYRYQPLLLQQPHPAAVAAANHHNPNHHHHSSSSSSSNKNNTNHHNHSKAIQSITVSTVTKLDGTRVRRKETILFDGTILLEDYPIAAVGVAVPPNATTTATLIPSTVKPSTSTESSSSRTSDVEQQGPKDKDDHHNAGSTSTKYYASSFTPANANDDGSIPMSSNVCYYYDIRSMMPPPPKLTGVTILPLYGKYHKTRDDNNNNKARKLAILVPFCVVSILWLVLLVGRTGWLSRISGRYDHPLSMFSSSLLDATAETDQLEFYDPVLL
jgi:hypothetical protein